MTKIKEKKQKEWKLPKRKQPVFRIFRKVFKHVYRATTESVIENLPEKAIIVSIHAAKKGPMAICLNYPRFTAMWGHHSMLGNYFERYKYLRNVLYIQKMHKNKFLATIKPIYEAIFAKFAYKGMHVIGTYTDMRFITTVRKSMMLLDDNVTVILFPEDSSEGYFNEVRHAFPGFAMLSSAYYQQSGEDVPVIPAYISNEKERFIVGEPRYVHEMELAGMSKQQIADVLKDDINALYHKYITTDAPVAVLVNEAPTRTRAYYGEDEKVT